MLPFLKKKEGSASSPVDVMHIGPEPTPEFGMLDAVAADLLGGIHSHDRHKVKAALEALIQHIQEEDEIQDQPFNRGI